ncbi:hypothetical protein IEO21_01199 [Rhodonia placenta]|uniref:VASt domain-containing protein n=1 Tax=Rhodonia placenta TaxID=104341 RepID=A0A8H7PA05_9APHY|nr:hypothetical protein IEO21_01199 [Postia placenta]
MAPNFLSKFVKNSPAHNLIGQNTQRSRSPSPAPSSQYPPSISVEPDSPSGSRPRRHTTVGSTTPSFQGSTESFPNVTVVPPSPRSTNYGSDITDEDPTPRSGQSPNKFSNGSAPPVPPLPNLSSVRPMTNDENISTPTPESTRTAFADQMSDTLSHSRSTGNLREKARAPEVSSRNINHPRSATVVESKSKESLRPSPVKKASKGSKTRGSASPALHPLQVTVSENGVLTSSPTSAEFPLPTSTSSSGYSAKTLPTYPTITTSLLAPDNSDAASTYSTNSNATSSKRRRGWPRKSGNNGHNSAQPGSSPAMSTTSLAPISPKRKTTGGGSFGYPNSDLSDRESFHSGQELLGDQSGLEDDDDLDLDPDDIPVTGFAVASARRNQDFHELFPTVPEGDYLIEDYGCALQREILIQGRLYVSENHVCFHANIFGWITDLTIPMTEIITMEKRMTAFVIPNAIQIMSQSAKYTFTSFLSRDNTWEVLHNIWRLARPEGSSLGSRVQSPRGSIDMLVSDTGSIAPPSASQVGEKKGKVQNKVTQCACGTNGEHLSEVAMENHGVPPFIITIVADLQISDWMPTADDPKLLYRQMSYIKPLSGGFGPKQTKCELRDETLHCDFDNYVCMLTTTRTPDVPSGSVFSVKTRTCITWTSGVSTKVLVTTQVEWTGRSFIKGIIEKSAIDGQKEYHGDLDKSMRAYIHEHQSEFIPEGVDPSVVEETESQAAEMSPRPSMERPSIVDQQVRNSRDFKRDQRGLQWAYDTFEGACKVAQQSTAGLLELIRDAWEQSTSTTILYFVIVFLVISNVWTLAMVGGREEAGRRKELKRMEEREKWVQGIVQALWEELVASKNTPGGTALSPSPRPIADWREEVGDINTALDIIEDRVRNIRESLAVLD